MTRQHLRHQAGGNPARGPLPDEANPEPSPQIGGEFPDAPDEEPSDRPQDQPDLDAFAARMGTDRLGDAGSRRRWSAENLRAPASGALDALATGVRSAARGLRRAAGRLAPGVGETELDLDELRHRVRSVHTAMVTTVDERGTLSSRPLTVQRVSTDGDVLFVVDRDADWVTTGIDAVNVALVDDGATWVSVAGRATTDDDTELLRDLWDGELDAWFPDGPDGAHARVLTVHADRWEYWTAPDRVARLVQIVSDDLARDVAETGRSGAIET